MNRSVVKLLSLSFHHYIVVLESLCWSNYASFTRKKENSRYNPQSTLMIYQTVTFHLLKRKDRIEYLGVLLDETVSFKHHISYGCTRILKWYYDQIFTPCFFECITQYSMKEHEKRCLPFVNICISSGDI